MKAAFLEKLMGKMNRLDTGSMASIVARLAEEKGFLETVFDVLEEGVLVLDTENRLLYLNHSAREMMGIPEGIRLGDSLKRHLPETFWKTLEGWNDFDQLQPSIHQDLEIYYPRHRFVQICARALSRESFPDGAVVLIIRDITKQRHREVLNAESERVNAVTDLAAGVAHELGNPLNSLHIYLQLMERELKNTSVDRRKLSDHLQVCAGEIARLDQIVNRFLKAVRPSPLNMAPHSLNEIVKAVLKVLEPEISNRDVLVEQEWGKDLPSVFVDSDQMKQVFFNVIRNGLQAMSSGGILHVKTELRDDQVMISLRDTGGGIPSAVLQKIFEPYFTTKTEGSGLGLMIVQRIIREHGGLIEVSSEEGRGTTFRIILPSAEKRVRLLANGKSREEMS